MRRFLATAFLCLLVVPAVAVAATSAPGDGTLVVRKATGKITVNGRGIVFGRFEEGTLTIVDYNRDDAIEPQVNGADRKVEIDDGKWQFKGDNIRFRFFGGRYRLVFTGASGIDISAVGTGTVTLTGAGPFFIDDYGFFSVDGSKFQPVTLATVKATFGTP
jgi:hypothetical protein